MKTLHCILYMFSKLVGLKHRVCDVCVSQFSVRECEAPARGRSCSLQLLQWQASLTSAPHSQVHWVFLGTDTEITEVSCVSVSVCVIVWVIVCVCVLSDWWWLLLISVWWWVCCEWLSVSDCCVCVIVWVMCECVSVWVSVWVFVCVCVWVIVWVCESVVVCVWECCVCQRSKDSSVSVSLGNAWLSFGSAADVSCLYSWCVLVPRMPCGGRSGVGVPWGSGVFWTTYSCQISVMLSQLFLEYTHIYIYIYIHTLHTHTHTHTIRQDTFKMGFMKLMKNWQ